LLGCSTRPNEPIRETIYEKQYIPLNLLLIECDETPPGLTVRSLGASWANNTGCLRAHKELVRGLIENYTIKGNTNNERGKE